MEIYKSFFEQLLNESIIKPLDYFEPIKEKCKEIINISSKETNLKFLCLKLTFLLRKYRIKFEPFESNGDPRDFLAEYGFIKGGTLSDKYGSIILTCNSNLLKIFDDKEGLKNFYTAFYTILKHELIHRQQYLNIRDKKIRNRISKSKDPNDIYKYMNDKYEIMAYAWQAIEYYRLLGGDTNQILAILKKPSDFHLIQNTVISLFYGAYNQRILTQSSLNLFKKYCYLYAVEE